MIERYSFRERVMHWLTALTYSYCLLTGLAFYSPHLFWIADALGGGPTSRFWHPIFGLSFFAVAIWMHAVWSREMALSNDDKKWLDHTKDYAENRDALLPPSDRFNAGQKVFYWAMYYGAAVLVVTGAIMWFPELVPFSFAWVRQLAILVHVSAALVTIGGFIIHVYMSVFLVPGSGAAMLWGSVPESWARTHHLLWYKRAVKK